LRAPAVANRSHLDVIRASADSLVKTMHSHVSGTSFPNRSLRIRTRIPIASEGLRDSAAGRAVHAFEGTRGQRRVAFYAAASCDQAKEGAKAASTGTRAPHSRGNCHQHFSAWRVLNRICTRHPQDFHIRALTGVPPSRPLHCRCCATQPSLHRLTYNAK
jgi:hypothetical protein